MRIKKLSLLIFILSFLLSNISYAALRDPTEPVIAPSTNESIKSGENFNLQIILIGPMRRLAMINDQIVGTGSKIQGARVLAIDKNHVVLFYGGRKKILHLFGRRMWKNH